MAKKKSTLLSTVGLSSFLIAAVISTVVVAVSLVQVSQADDHQHNFPTEGPLLTSIKSVETICAATNFQDSCKNALTPAVGDNADSTEVIRAAANATIDHVIAALEKANVISTEDALNKMAIDNCKELLGYAIDELKAVVQEATDLKGRSADMRTWLSAVLSYQETCLDGFSHPDLKGQMQTGLVNATQLTSNALALVTVLSSAMHNFAETISDLNITTVDGRMLTDDNFPEWMEGRERKLMGSKGNAGVKPNIVVAQDGSGQFKTIKEAVAAIPKKNTERFIIYVKAGVYKEQVTVKEANVFMYGDGPRKTMVTGDKHQPDVTTYLTSTFSVVGQGFICKGMGFVNTAGPNKPQAVALRVQGDMAAFYNCRMDAYQDTLYAQAHRQFYRNCVVAGTIDFIFGDSSSVFQNCLIICRRPKASQANTVTAHGRTDKNEPTAIVIHNCKIVPDQNLFPERFNIPTYLGRPWKQYAQTIIMESTLGDFIRPEGWMPWNGDFALDTLYYAEYNNRGPGAKVDGRVKWKGVNSYMNKEEAIKYTVGPFIQKTDQWLEKTGAPFNLGLRY